MKAGIIAAAAALAVIATSTSAFAWSYGDEWIIPLDPGKNQNGNSGLQGSWNFSPTGGYAGSGYYWRAGYDSVSRARFFFDNSIHGGDAPTSAELFEIWTWVPAANANAYNVVEVSFSGNGDEEGTNNPNIPWAGQFGTNHQWINRNQGNQGAWVKAGAGPQTPEPGRVYAQAGSYFWVGGYGFYGPNDMVGVSAIKVKVVPEPGSMLALGAGLASMAGMMIRRKK